MEEAHIKLSSLVSDLFCLNARRMLQALADGKTDPTALAALAHQRLRAMPEQQIGQLDQEIASLLASIRFEILYRRLVPRLGHNKTIGAIVHRLCQLIWLILHNGIRYEERGPAVSENSKRLRTLRMIRTLRNLGYRVEPVEIAG